MENYKKKAIDLISNLLLEYKYDPTVVAYYPAKTRIMKNDRRALPVGAPQAHGIPSGVLVDLLRSLENEPRANVHSIVIVKDGAVIAKAAAPGYSTALPHLSHSMSKTVTGMLISALFDRGALAPTDKVTDIFSEFRPKDERFYKMTVKHLLTMSSGVAFAEVGSVTESEWTRAFFESEMMFAPGEKFNYNSMNSYILMRIADRIAHRVWGTDADVVLKEFLLAPMGIDNWFWEKSPEGIYKGGWGLYLSAESWARLGVMMMQGGVFGGRRILSEESVKSATSAAISVPPEISPYDYGHQLWVERDGGGFLFNGMLGQNVWICPKRKIVVAVMAGSCELMQGSPAVSLIRESLSKKGDITGRASRDLENKCKDFFTSREWITLHAPLRGLPYLLGLKNRTPFDKALLPLIDKYVFPTNNLGILPSFVSVMQNNYGGGIKSLEFSHRGGLLHMCVELGVGVVDLDLGIYSYADGILIQQQERYLVKGAISADTDGDGGLIYHIELIFPELPNTRRITLTLSPDGRLHMLLREVPDERLSPDLLRAAAMTNPKLSSLFTLLERTLGHDYIGTKFGELFSPEVSAFSANSPNLDSLLREENERIAARINSSRLVRSIVSRFSAEDMENDVKSRGVCAKVSNLLGKFRRS